MNIFSEIFITIFIIIYFCFSMCYNLTTSVVYWSEFLATERRCIVFPVRYELNLYVM
jgi:hypothetical protein